MNNFVLFVFALTIGFFCANAPIFYASHVSISLLLMLFTWYITRLYRTLRYNKRSLVLLMDRYLSADSAVKVGKLHSPASYANSQRLSLVLKAMENFVNNEKQYSKLQKFLKAKSI